MAQAEKSQNKLTQQDSISRSKNNFPQVLLQRLPSGNHLNHNLHDETEEDEEKEIELNLGLSLNGRFGVDPRSKKLTRSSSIPDFNNPTREIGSAFIVPVKSTNLLRTCSLPTETEEECRKRKEIQCLRRMEAKRKRSEKLRNLKAVKGRNWGFGVEGCEDGKTVKNGTLGNTDNQSTQGTNKHTETRSPASIQSSSECEQKLTEIPGSTFTEKLGITGGVSTEDKRCNMTAVIANGAKEMVRNVLEDMPFVSTKVDGPNGKRIEGFLYRYTKGEEVRIVCVCHGSFLTPAEFVKHAGGGDVANPLKHIVVNPSLF